MRFNRKKQNTFFIVVLVVQFFASNVFTVFALGPSINLPSPTQVMQEIESRYHLNQGALQNEGETNNVVSNKGYAPDVTLFFDPSDPKEGEKITAKAFPMYFSSPEKSMYFTWYLKRKGCDLKKNVTDVAILDKCNASDINQGIAPGTKDPVTGKPLPPRENPGNITVEDWKILAMRMIAQNGYSPEPKPDYISPSPAGSSWDDDGYKAYLGGDDQIGKTNYYCYINDKISGINYELNGPSSSTSSSSLTCPFAGTSPACLSEAVSSGDSGDYKTCFVLPNAPSCLDNVVTCSVGNPRCIRDADLTKSSIQCSFDMSLSSAQPPVLLGDSSPVKSCTTTTTTTKGSCDHLFPNADKAAKQITGDGSFTQREEQFWGTDPQDPSTANNGQKDEANVAGLGQSSFTWNYVAGDQVGVAVEGMSLYQTKYDNSTGMIMWAFSKGDCPLDNTNKNIQATKSSKTQTIKGYPVIIPTVTMDLNDCLEGNLIDPTKGGQASNLSVNVSATPENPINDPGTDKSGDTVMVQASVDNAAKDLSNLYFEWKVIISPDISFNSATSRDITNDMRAAGLLSNVKGNALDSINLKLNIPGTDMKKYIGTATTGYLKFQATAKENFSSSGPGSVRTGKSDVIVKFVSTNNMISAYKVKSVQGVDSMQVALSDSSKPYICDTDSVEKVACPVIKNQIIGLKMKNTTGDNLTNFTWTINGAPLLCTARVSERCSLYGEKIATDPKATPPATDKKIDSQAQSDTNFFPATGNPGDTYTVTMTANNVSTGEVVTLTRTFNIVDPKVFINSPVPSLVWPKFLGQYKDISGSTAPICKDGLCDDLSETTFQTYSGSTISLKANFIPTFLDDSALTKKEWSLDGNTITEDTPGIIKFLVDKAVPGIYTVNLLAQTVQPDGIRRALADIWGVTAFDSPEINYSSSIQVEVQDQPLTEGPLNGPRKYYAAIASYIPGSVLFTFRIFLSAALTLFVLGLLNAMLEERRVKTFTENFFRSKRE